MDEYIKRSDAIKVRGTSCTRDCSDCDFARDGDSWCEGKVFVTSLLQIPAADVLPRDEAIKIGADLAAMHNATPEQEQLEKAYLDGVEEGMKRRDVRPVVRARWTVHRTNEHDGEWYCSACGKEITIYMGPDRVDRYSYCPNCGADMREVDDEI